MEVGVGSMAEAWDEATGRDLRRFPPDRIVDIVHMRLEMTFDELNDARFSALETLRFIPLGAGTDMLTLDAVGLDIKEVRMDGRTLQHYVDDDALTIAFDPPLAAGDEQELTIRYDCVQPYDGMYFTPSSSDAPNYSAEVHTQGQTVTNRHWFVCHDAPNDRMTTELIVTVPSEYSVSSNGRLASSIVNGDRAVWHYVQDKPHVAYLVSLVIGKFDIVPLEHPRVPMAVWVPEGLGHQVEQTYGRTGEMIDLFERRLGLAYPWARYDQITVKNFRSGGMENTSVTSMYPTAILDETALLDGDIEGLIAHELAHQWTGDLITCKGWQHIWLNEGWATFGSALWFEQRDGQDGYLDSIRRNFRRVTNRDKTTNALPMVSTVYEHEWENFRRAANPYPKGASILHMLRMMLGEEVFWAGVELYINRHALGEVETNDFRYAMEEVSGRGLEWFFEQWCYRPGTPRLEATVTFEPSTRQLHIDVVQTQHIDARTPAYRFTLPVHVQVNGTWRVYNIAVTQRETSFNVALDGLPSVVAIDPELHVLKTLEVDKPQTMWMSQAQDGPTIAARHQAVDALGQRDSPEAIELLAGIIVDPTLRHTLRSSAVSALGAFGSDASTERLLQVFNDGMDDARVRAALIEQIADDEPEGVAELLAQAAGNDESYAVRVRAIDKLAALEATEHADLVAELVHFPSQHEQVRSAAIRALDAFDDPRGLDLAIQYSAYGITDRARASAVGMLDDFAEQDQERAVALLLELLDDPERRCVEAAGAALARTGDERAEEALATMRDTHANPKMRTQAEGWIEIWEKRQDEDAAAADDDD
jgi:aminopeptidase N